MEYYFAFSAFNTIILIKYLVCIIHPISPLWNLKFPLRKKHHEAEPAFRVYFYIGTIMRNQHEIFICEPFSSTSCSRVAAAS